MASIHQGSATWVSFGSIFSSLKWDYNKGCVVSKEMASNRTSSKVYLPILDATV